MAESAWTVVIEPGWPELTLRRKQQEIRQMRAYGGTQASASSAHAH
ncbi:hypothetical protein [Brevundimonas mediterranea]|nr:hypothetical protein [Brevundimonas mediterranea]